MGPSALVCKAILSMNIGLFRKRSARGCGGNGCLSPAAQVPAHKKCFTTLIVKQNTGYVNLHSRSAAIIDRGYPADEHP
ncbi:MAG: hypothetical protein J5544_05580, partial [Clostridia bacterium]|nr:hypothetical protein [Clostridia bacterium]